MAWHAPADWTAESLVTETKMNEQVRDNLTVLAVAIDTGTGKIAGISSTYFASLDGTNLTGVAKLAADNSFTAGTHDFGAGAATRLRLPVGADKWAV